MAIPPNMKPYQYERLIDLRGRIPSLTPDEMKDLKDLNALSISHLQFSNVKK